MKATCTLPPFVDIHCHLLPEMDDGAADVAETLAMALCDVYTFGPTFRADNSNTSRHLAEFWMVEPEMAFKDLDDDMDLAEAFLK